MRKRSKGRMNNFRINRNFFIFQGIMILLLMCLAWGSWVKFIIFIALEITAYFTFIYYFLAKQSNKKRKKKSIHSKEVYNKVESNTRRIVEESEPRASRRVGRNNFNWEISKRSPEQKPMSSSDYTSNALNKNTETSKVMVYGYSSVNDSKKSVSGEEIKKFVPYRSPFDPIRPKVEEQKVETDKASELLDVNVPDTEDIKVELNQSKEENIEEIIEASIEQNIDENMPELQMECNKQSDTLELKFEDNLYEYSEGNENTNFIMAEEVSYDVEPSPISVHEEKIGTFHGQINQEVNNVGFEDKKPMPFNEVNKKVQTDFKLVQSGKMLLNIAEYEPPVELLKKNEVLNYDEETEAYIEYNSHKLIDTLASFGVGARVLNVSKGPTVTRYELQPNAGVKVSKIINLADDIALNLAATGVRIEAPIPGKAAVGIEIPNKNNVPVFLRDVIDSEVFKNHPSKLAFAVGKDIAGNVVVGDIAKMPHLLIAGATGSGKSVCINTLIVSILYKASPAEVRLLMVDPKVVELGIYNGIPHLLIPVVTDPKKAAGALTWAVIEMTNRYRIFAENNVRDLSGYNALIKERGEGETLPQIVIIIDELADLMMVAPGEVEDSICRLAQMARAAGMHLVIATQRPSVNVITGVIKANIPSRISFAVSSQIDSRTILDMAGAEKLLGRGDMLFYPLGQPKPLRVQGSFISDKEVDKIVTHIKSLQCAEYDEEILQKIDNQTEQPKPDASGDDELLPQAIVTVLELGQASASLIQRKFKVGYSRAARILDQMESWGVVSASDGSSRPRQILITRQEWDELNA
uniref:DNA translocase FtsK n=1 Tax=Acetivibrio cellulolyticus TaxID=35830 RepID=UPI0001E2F5A6